MTKTTLGRLQDEHAIRFSDGYRTKQSEHGPGLPILRVREVDEGAVRAGNSQSVREEFKERIGAKASVPGDLLVTTKGTVGRVARIPEGFPEHVYSPQLCFVRVIDAGRVDPMWLYGWMRSPEFAEQLHIYAYQTDMAPYLSLGDLSRFSIDLPPIALQRRIAGVLTALENLIDINQKLAASLEEEARLLGDRLMRSLTLVDRVPLSELAEIQKGYSYKSAELVAGGRWLVNLKNVGTNGRFQERGFKPLSGSPKRAHIVESGDIIVAQTDLTQSRRVIARPVRVRRSGRDGELVASLDLMIVRPRVGVTREYIHALLSQPEFRTHALGYCNGTTVLHMGSRALPEYRAPLIDGAAMSNFSAQVRPLLEVSDSLLDEARELVMMRTELLPILMSGQVVPGEVT